jgi:cell division protein FtsL
MKDEHVEQQAARIDALQQQIRDLQRAATVRSVKKF